MKTVSASEHPYIQQLSVDQRLELKELTERKAWLLATRVQRFTEQELRRIRRVEREKGLDAAKLVRKKLYLRHHWNSLRWFLFGGLVDLPVASDPDRAWDPDTNPWLKLHVPGWAWTHDEHDDAEPYKRLPDKDYLRLYAYAWVHEPRLLIPKSRQLMVTWLFCCIGCHETLFRQARRSAFISKKFDDADALIDRVEHVHSRLPQERFYVPKVRRVEGEFECRDSGSVIQAMGEEAKGLRQFTYSWIFSDEMAYQDQADDMVQAALPTLKQDRFTGVSSANGEEVFHSMLSDNGDIPVSAGV